MTTLISALFAAVLGSVANPADEAEPWIRHPVKAFESPEDIARSYGVSVDELTRWNELDDADVEPGSTIRVRARMMPPPLQKRRVRLYEELTWDEAALRYGVDTEDLRHWNSGYRRHETLPKGARLVLWISSGVQAYPLPPLGAALPEVDFPLGGWSVGHPNKGRLVDGVALPESDSYTVRIAYQSYGSAYAVYHLQRALLGFRSDTGFQGELTIGALSRRTGRRLQPHRSHQSGRDVDVRLPAMRFAAGKSILDPHEVDWYATWALIDALVRTDAVQVIFLERRFYARLRRAAMRLGAGEERTAFVMDKVRHSKGHTSHIHVRFHCGDHEPRCRDESLAAS